MALTNIETTIILDLYDHDTTPTKIKAIALDSKTRYVLASLRNNGNVYDAGQNTTVTLTIIRPDNVGVQITGETRQIVDLAPEGEVTVYGVYAELSQAALAVKGTLRAQFMLTSGKQVLRTEIFTINCGEALDASTSEWADEYQGYNLDELVQNVNESSAKVDAMEEDVSDLKEGFNDLYNTAYVTDSANGSVAHFEDGADNVPMKSLKVNIVPVQSGSGDPSPDNVRPISGRDSVNVTRNGRNFCKSAVTATRTNLNGLTATPNGDGSITINGTATATTILYFNLAVENGANNASQANGTKNLRSGTYRFKELPSGIYLQIYGSDMPNAGTSDARLIKEGRKGSFTVDDTYQYNWIRLLVERDTTFNNVVIYPAIYLASDTDDTYDPYNGNTYNISLASAGTVYGGTLDVVSGELTVDRKMATIDGSNYALGVLSGVYNNRYCYRNTYLGGIIEKNLPSETTKACCNMLKSMSRSNATSASSGIFQYHGDNDELRFLFPLEDAYSTPDKIYALGLECCIPLAIPLTYQLSAQEIKSLLGINNIWSDAGDVDVEYRADTKLYIKRLTDSDTDMIADANITSGQYFMVGNDLYKATVNIASGAQIEVGTNATKVSLSEALNEINT